MRHGGAVVVRGVVGAIAGAILGIAYGVFVAWAVFYTLDLPRWLLTWIAVMSGPPGAFVGAVFAQATAIRRCVVCCLLGGAAGAVVGMIFMGFFGLTMAPHQWVTLGWMENMLILGSGAGVFGGLVVGAISWLLREWTVVDAISRRISRVSMLQHRVVRKVVGGLLGGLVGAVLGVVAGALVEVAVAMQRVLLSPEGMRFSAGDFTRAGYVVSGVGTVLGVVYSLVGKVTAGAVKRVMIGLTSGVVFGIGFAGVGAVVGAIDDIRSCVAYAAIFAAAALVLGVPVGLIGGLVGRFTEQQGVES